MAETETLLPVEPLLAPRTGSAAATRCGRYPPDRLASPPGRAARVGLVLLYVGRLSEYAGRSSLRGGGPLVISTSSGLYATATRLFGPKPRPERSDDPPRFGFADAADNEGNCCLSDGSARGCAAAALRDVDDTSFGSNLCATRFRALNPRPELSDDVDEREVAAEGGARCEGLGAAGLVATG